MQAKDIILSYIKENDEELSYIAKDIWDHPQVALQEEYASKLLAEKMREAGFAISWGAGGMAYRLHRRVGRGRADHWLSRRIRRLARALARVGQREVPD